MIIYVQNNKKGIFSINPGEGIALVNPVNLKGVIDAGLAKVFKEKFPNNFKKYQWACKEADWFKNGSGNSLFVRENGYIIVNFPTKIDWKEPSSYTFIHNSLRKLRDSYSKWGIKTIAMPKVGCGLGGLDWNKVKPLIEKVFDQEEVKLFIFE